MRPTDRRAEALRMPAPMRVALCTETFLPKVDGIVNTVCRLLEHLRERGHTAMLIAPEGGPEQYAGFPVFGLRSRSFPLYPELRLAAPTAGIADALAAFRPALVHVVNPISLGVAGLRQARRLGLPVVASYHTDLAGFATQWGLGALSPAIWAFVRWVHGQADLNLCPSYATMFDLVAEGVPRLAVWTRGVDSERFHPRRHSETWRHRLTDGHPDAPILLYVGRLSPEKRIDWLVDVLDALPSSRLAVVGDGPAREALQRRFAGRPALFTGYLLGDDLADAYAAADVFVFPGAHETFGNVVLEASASGLPVVAARRGGVLDHVQENVTGLLFDPDDRADLVRAVVRLLACPPLASRLGAAGRRRAEGMTWSSAMDNLILDYAALIAARRGSYRPAA